MTAENPRNYLKKISSQIFYFDAFLKPAGAGFREHTFLTLADSNEC
jgi:hypothetical protein